MTRIANLLDGIALAKIYRDSTDILDFLEPLWYPVNDVDLGGAANKRAVGGHCPHRTASENSYSFARRDLRHLSAMISCGEDIGQHGKIFLVFGSLRQFQGIKIGVWYPQIIRLPAGIGSHSDIPIGATGKAWIHRQAEAGEASLAVLTKAACHVERHDHTITFA